MFGKIFYKLFILYCLMNLLSQIGAKNFESFSGELKILDNINLNKSDSIECKIIGIYPKESKYDVHVINSVMPDVVNYYLLSDKQECLSFRVRAKNNVNLKIENSNYVFWILLGGWHNTKSVIRLDDITVASAETVDLLSDSEFRSFWITWTGGILKIGKNEDSEPFLSYVYSMRIQTEFIGFQTAWGSTAVWVIGEKNPNCLRINDFEGQTSQIQCCLNEETKY